MNHLPQAFSSRFARPTRLLAFSLGAATLVAGLSACVPLVVGGAAATGMGLVATDRRTSGVQLDDQGIELRAAARVREVATDTTYASVTSFNRQVLITGTVGTEAERQRVGQAVLGTPNIRNVYNELVVAPRTPFQERSNDTLLTSKVKASMLDAKDIFANSFKVVTDRGVVYLMGLVSQREADRATEIVRGISGVQKVVRVLEVVNEDQLGARGQPGGVGSATTTTAPAAPAAAAPAVVPASAPAPVVEGVTASPVR